jgi:hypothetical protein
VNEHFSLLMRMLEIECSDSDYVQINATPFQCPSFYLNKSSSVVVFSVQLEAEYSFALCERPVRTEVIC